MKSRALFLFILLLVSSVFAGSVLAQDGLRMEFDRLDNDATPNVQDAGFPQLGLIFTPMNQSGVPIDGLRPGDFSLRENGAPVDNFTLTEMSDPNQGISVVLVLDVSGSMSEDIDALRAAAATLYDTVLQQTDESAIITFAVREDGTGVNLSDPFPQMVQGIEEMFTNDEGRLKNLINAILIDESAGTPLYDAIYKGARLARDKAANSRRVVIVMTDGVDANRQGVPEEGSTIYDRNSLIEELRALNVPVFTVGLGNEIDGAFLQRVANATGGTYQHAPQASDLANIFTDVASQLKTKYQLSFQAGTKSDGQSHNLELTARTPQGTINDTASYQAYYPIIPWVQDVQAANPRQDFRSLSTFESVKGIVTLEPAIVARGDIAAVDFLVNDQLMQTANTTPWQFRWDTSGLTPNEVHTLTIEARDDENPPNVGRTSYQLLVEECTMICLFEQQTGIPVHYWLIGLSALLLLFVAFMIMRRRRAEPVLEPTFVPPVFTPIQPPTEPPAPQPMRSTIASTGVSSGVEQAGQRPRAKTEVISRAPSRLAYLIDADTGRQFQLSDSTSIGKNPDNDIPIDEPSVSGRHAKIKLENGEFAIFDLASTNGTQVNGNTISHQVLADGDRVQLGRKTLTFKAIS